MLESLRSWLRGLLGTPVSIETDPLDDDTAELVTVREYGGTTLRGTTKNDRSVQLVFRSATPDTAKTAAWAVYRSLISTPPVLETGGLKLIVRPKQTPFHFGTDALGHTKYAFNVAVYAPPD